ncbi:MAG: NADH-quinone oxidoreductase subunit M [Halothiobacillaceae bacterium]|jgi:NADH-quinone oxidoreductase subunit M|nr:NADH-quinone oxidoreductase subunit M [Halothiobacillaceae bacterium]
MFESYLLSIVIFLPLLGALLIGLTPRNDELIRWIALAFSLLVFAASLPLWYLFDISTHEMQFVERMAWIPTLNIEYAVGLDGISLLMVLLTTLVTPLCVLCSWRSIGTRVKEFMMALLIMETAMLGVFAALDFILFYFLWEAMLIPMYLIIGVWGGPRRIYATTKFFLYTLLGSLPLLVAILALYFMGGETFDIQKLSTGTYSQTAQFWIFWAFFLGFAIKVPMFPFHTWLPDAHVEAPTAGSVILASVMLKMGAYGFLRFSLPMVPDASIAYAPIMIALSLIAILWGSYMALAQTDMKKLIAYSSVGHMGFVTLGIFVFNTQGIEGAILQMFNHGITTGALFLCVGMIYERTHSREIADCSGLRTMMPAYITLLTVFSFSSFGFPGTNSFISELLILVGAFADNLWFGAITIGGVVLSMAYMLWLLQRIVWGAHTRTAGTVFPDLNGREISTLIPLLVLVFWIGFNPGPFLDRIKASVGHLVSEVAVARGIEMTKDFR